jgi:two-component system, chemotaxis family, chemotaxis protein CheY
MSINVLVIDDSSVMRAMIRKSLQLSGIELQGVYEAADGKQGIDILDYCCTDLIITDINMPVMNGEAMIEQIKNNPKTKDIPILVISSEGSKLRVGRLKDKGVSFIHKPFFPETIRDMIRTILKKEDCDERAD